MASANDPKTLREAILFFSDYENCRKAVEAIRWPSGKVTCPTCGSDNVTWLATQKRYKCYAKHPKAQFSLKVGTIFEDSALGFEKWLPALWLLTNCKNGISSYELGRALGVTQKSAWFMLSRLRLALQGHDGGKMSGTVEVDETFIGGKARFMSDSKRKRLMVRGSKRGKVAVMGLLERRGKDSQVRVTVVKGVKRHMLMPHIRENVQFGTDVYTDAFPSYDSLNGEYVHKVIDHAQKYVDGQVHTNSLENFWSLLKRALKGTYVSVEPFHLFRYLDEQAFRFNNRTMTDAQRFAIALKGIINKRLTYTALTGSELPQTC
jgi:transposase-like protein